VDLVLVEPDAGLPIRLRVAEDNSLRCYVNNHTVVMAPRLWMERVNVGAAEDLDRTIQRGQQLWLARGLISIANGVFAIFETLTERLGRDMAAWPEPFRDARTDEVRTFADGERRAVRYAMWLQWRLAQQLSAVADAGRAAGVELYRDLAVGVDDIYKTCEELKHKGVKVTREPGPMKFGGSPIASRKTHIAGYRSARQNKARQHRSTSGPHASNKSVRQAVPTLMRAPTLSTPHAASDTR